MIPSPRHHTPRVPIDSIATPMPVCPGYGAQAGSGPHGIGRIGPARRAVLLFGAVTILAACGDGGAAGRAPEGICRGESLFGRPSSNTGLDASQCTDTCPDCDGGPFSPPAYDEAFVAGLRAWRLLDPPSPVRANPYDSPPALPVADTRVCAVRIEDPEERTYRLETWPGVRAAAEAGAIMTHDGACGVCSDLESLAVYAGVGDLTQPVRRCGILGLLLGEERNLQCLYKIGFNAACASIWYWNTVNTRAACQNICLQQVGDPYHTPDGALNDCLRCDEERSGPVFKAVAGRTRRNSGLATALCRPCAEVRPLTHRYE